MGQLSRAGALLSACTLAAMLWIASPASAAVRLGSAPAVPANAHTVSALAASTPMRVTVTLQPQDPAGLAAFANEVSTPSSRLYRDYITPTEFAQRFGATPGAVQAVESSLQAHGLVPGPVSPNSLSIPVTATAGALSQAFATSFSRVALPTGTTAIVNQQAPSLDAGIATDVQAVIGLNTLSTAKPLLIHPHAAAAPLAPEVRPHVVTGGPQPCSAATLATGQGGYTADQIASAYGFSGLYQADDEGARETVAILELEPYALSDIEAYGACYGVNPLIDPNIPVEGGAGTGSGSGEAALDIENVIGLAPQARIAVYEGPNSGNGPYETMSEIISQHLAQVVTTSWGQCEAAEGSDPIAAENTLFQEAALEGMSILSASGDDGSEDCDLTPGAPQNALAVDDPASQPYVTGVGGTSLSTIPLTRPSETVWNDGFPTGASGGGVSSMWPMPAYQTQAASFLHVLNGNSSGSPCNAPSGDCREVPDVSADGDPDTGYVIYYDGSWQVVGGTSAAAPAWAALIALTNASVACDGVPLGFANPALYHAAAVAYGADFNDVTSGDNDMTGSNGGLFPAGPGYDMATGLGSPNAAELAQTLCTDAITLANPGQQRTTVKTPVSLQINATDTRGQAVTYTAPVLPIGLTINSSTGKITGTPKRIGNSSVTVTVSDAEGTPTQITFEWIVQGAPTISHVSLSRVGAAHPRLSFIVAAGRNAASIKLVNITLPRGLHFTKSRATVTVTGPKGKHLKFTARLVRGALVLTLKTASPQVHVTISSPRLAASSSLTAALARHHAEQVTVTVRLTDAGKLTTRLSKKLKPS